MKTTVVFLLLSTGLALAEAQFLGPPPTNGKGQRGQPIARCDIPAIAGRGYSTTKLEINNRNAPSYGLTPFSYDYGAQSAPTTDAGSHSHKIIAGGDSESRPVNAYVYFIIRAK
jgi:hypothetical protein